MTGWQIAHRDLVCARIRFQSLFFVVVFQCVPARVFFVCFVVCSPLQTGRSLQIRPPPLSSGGVESSELRFALDSDGTKYFTIRASSSELAFYNFNQEKIFAFPAVGDFVFENAVNFGFELKVSSSENDAVLTAITTSPGMLPSICCLWNALCSSCRCTRLSWRVH